MGEPYKNSEKFTKDLIQEAGLEKPSASFELKILEKIEAKPLSKKTTPLISKKGWFILCIIFLVSSVLIYMYPSETLSLKEYKISTLFSKLGRLEISSFSATTQYAFIFLALFLVQIPFLKHYLDKQRV